VDQKPKDCLLYSAHQSMILKVITFVIVNLEMISDAL